MALSAFVMKLSALGAGAGARLGDSCLRGPMRQFTAFPLPCVSIGQITSKPQAFWFHCLGVIRPDYR